VGKDPNTFKGFATALAMETATATAATAGPKQRMLMQSVPL